MSSLHVTESCGQTVKRRGENLPTASVRQIFNYLVSGLKLLLYTVTFEYINYCIYKRMSRTTCLWICMYRYKRLSISQ
jgi:hypothetical protein